jgi:hypothetical protein
VPHAHAPSRQVSAESPHAFPQRPQLATLVCVLMQVPLQQLSLPPHTRPQAPQWPTLVLTSTHSPPQQRWPAVQRPPAPQRHVPPMQVSPRPHAGSQGTSLVQLPRKQT